MGLAEKLGMGDQPVSIDWDLTPSDTFAMFESWGGKDQQRIRSNSELHYYFYIDNWSSPAKLCLMERGVKHAKVLAHIDCPQEMLKKCVAKQGKDMRDQSYAIDAGIKQWLLERIIESEDFSRIALVDNSVPQEEMETGLPKKVKPLSAAEKVSLRATGTVLNASEVTALAAKIGGYDSRHNPQGNFRNVLVDNGNGLTVTDLATGLMWQRGGCDLTTIRTVQKYVEELNAQRFAGFSDWRLPTMEEGFSLLVPQVNAKGVHLHPCFSKEQPFIFLADQRKPGGYWFIDFKQGTAFWASGSIPGGFGRVCRTM
ncbi:Lcl C-terminal domain-containing protein [Thiovibrio frasassiensis]|uniref:DUF1566 domain-containing protein n=1 Tax=Thiovibrio frasassiensis TaxID=2984131 RepID=A0A9X4MGG1_9BACT|nr:DUF1566 domain-containing protein [Thiovibrio frasassiensis]MDG4475078.1 DUF1566 domain-containing protein [Thiovibrio frasassiensis]